MADKEWYTLQDLVTLLDVPYHKIRGAVFFLRTNGTITTRENPRDARVLEVHKDSLAAIREAVGVA